MENKTQKEEAPPSSGLQRARDKARENEKIFNYEHAVLLNKADAKLEQKRVEGRNLLQEVMTGQLPMPAPDITMNLRAPEIAKPAPLFWLNKLKSQEIRDTLTRYKDESSSLLEQGKTTEAGVRILHSATLEKLMNTGSLSSDDFAEIANAAIETMKQHTISLGEREMRGIFQHMQKLCWGRHWIQANPSDIS